MEERERERGVRNSGEKVCGMETEGVFVSARNDAARSSVLAEKVVDPFKGNLFIARLSFLPAFVRSERSKGSISNDSYTSKFKIHEQRTPELPGVRVKKVDLRIGKT